jgi:branched-subunit amino acid transport protein
MALVTYLTRFPVLVWKVGELPPRWQRFLQLVPLAMIAALITPQVFLVNGSWVGWAAGGKLLAGAVAVVTAYRTRSMLWTIIAAVGSLCLWRAFLG